MFLLFPLLILGKHKYWDNEYHERRITLKLDGSDRFLVVGSDGKPRLGDYREAAHLKLNTMSDISRKKLEGSNNKALTESGFWFFPKSYSFKNITNSSKQEFTIVYYDTNKYILKMDSSCLGFNSSNKFKRVDCKRGSASIFNICTSRSCDSYVDIKKDIECLKAMIISSLMRGRGRRGYNDDSTDSSSDIDWPGNGRYPKNKWKGNSRNEDDSDDDYMGCKEFRYGPFPYRNRPGQYDWRNHPDQNDWRNRYVDRGFNVSGIMSGNHLGLSGNRNNFMC